MKKRTKFRLKNDLIIPFRIAVSICLIGALVSYFLFHNNFFKALTKLNEKPIATITFKYKTAERKFLDRVIWDRLKQNSPVYNGDTIHTAELSEATVWFDDGSILELSENSMAQVFLHSNGLLETDLSSGSANVDSSVENKGFTLVSSNVSLSVEAGSKVSAKKSSDEKLILSLQKGNAVFADGELLAEGKAFSVSDGVKKETLFNVTKPAQNQKFLYFSEKSQTVDFEWNSREENSSYILQVAKDKNFENIVNTLNASGLNKVSLKLPEGIYYWKLTGNSKDETDETEKYSSSGKIQLIQSLRPKLLVPVKDFSYTYRKQKPSIRFIWDESQSASSYRLSVSKNSDMSEAIINETTAIPSIIISTLQAGNYYYQVTPYYSLNHEGYKNPSETGSFKVEQKEELLAPRLTSPSNSEFVDKRKQTSLSWKMSEEAMVYTLRLSKNEDLSDSFITRKTVENYVTFTAEELKKLEDGQYFWAVSQTDSEGNESELSEIRRFYALDGKIEQRTIFPPDNYTLWKPLLVDTRFTWKSNLNLSQYFQLSQDENFKELIVDNEITSTSCSISELDEGIYYWRITTKDKNFLHSSSAKKLSIVSELDPAEIIIPSKTKKAIVRPSEPCVFEWKSQEDADYYRVKIFKQTNQNSIYDENFITDNKLYVNVEDFSEGFYRWELQAYSFEDELKSRRSSLLSESSFQLRKIRPVIQLLPADKTHIGGWQAIEKPPVLTWSSNENYSKAKIILTKKSGIEAGDKVFTQYSYRQPLQPLSSGEYEWSIQASTIDNIDISSQNKFTFIVDEIPPFPIPKGAKTESGSVFDAEYLRKSPYIVFSWESVSRADDYYLEIIGKNKKVLHTAFLPGNKNTSYKFDNLEMLEKGNFVWKVRACRLNQTKDEILIDGIPAENTFTINYNLNRNGGKRKNRGDLYAQ